MTLRSRLLIIGLLLTAALSAQSINVYSEFRRVDPFGQIVPMDRGGSPREILSPLFARNSHATLLLVVNVPRGLYYLYVTATPETAMGVTIYKALYMRQSGVWIPDRLRPIDSPYTGRLPDSIQPIQDQTAELFVVDIWVPRNTEPGRMKLDVQLNVGDLWITYPMEIRISTEIAPSVTAQGRSLPPVAERSDRSLLGPLRAYLCGAFEQGSEDEITIRGLIRRNVIEDIALARAKETELGRDEIVKTLLRGLDIDSGGFCEAKALESSYGPEWFLRARDALYRGYMDYY